MSNDNKLKPCPFCGGDAVNENTPDYDWIECSLCRCQSESFVNRDAAITAWNRRASPWISVDERLPREGQNIIAIGTWRGEISGVGEDEYTGIGTWMGDRVVIDSDTYSTDIINVTHWMPLPALPEVSSD